MAAHLPDSIEVWVRVYNANNDDPAGISTPAHSAALAGDPQEAITGISINGVALTAAQFAALPKDVALGVLVSGLDLNDTVQVTNSGGYNRIEIENAINFPALNNPSLNGEFFDVGGFSFVTTTTTIPSVDLSFDLGLTDADGDTVVSPDAITVQLQAPSVPTVLVAIADALLNDSVDTSTVTFTFSQAPTGFTADDITAVGGTVTGLAGSGTSYTATFTATSGFTGIGSVSVLAGSYADSRGDPGGAGTDFVVIDTVAPVASISLDAITGDNIVNAAEAGGTVAVTGTVGGDVQVGDTVTLTVNGTPPTPAWCWRLDVQHRRCGQRSCGRHQRACQRHGDRRGGQRHHGDRRPGLHGRHGGAGRHHRGGGVRAAGWRNLACHHHVHRGGDWLFQCRPDGPEGHLVRGHLG